jgi:hypothetical protein
VFAAAKPNRTRREIDRMFPIRQVDQTQSEDIEYLGTKRKFWFTVNGQRYLFKAEERGTGEDWAEKVCCELARRLGLPHVEYELAHEYEGKRPIQPGVICPTFVPRPLVLILGNQLLYNFDPQYPVSDEAKYGVSAHTIEAVAGVLRSLRPPAPEWMRNAPAGITTALGVFIGYVMLDAWVANQDRHHQNWGAIHDGGTPQLAPTLLRLAPTYDHGASLARNLTDEERKSRLHARQKSRSVEYFAGRARSGFYRAKLDRKTLPTLEVFQHFGRLEPEAAKIWLAKLGEIGSADVDAILAEVPPQRMSPITRQFTLSLLCINQRRLQSMIQL